MSEQLEKISPFNEQNAYGSGTFKQFSQFQDYSYGKNKSKQPTWDKKFTLPQIIVFGLCIILFIQLIFFALTEKSQIVEDSAEQKIAKELESRKNQTSISQAQTKFIDITVAIINKKRYDLLTRSLESFFTFNTYQVSKIIIVEDGVKNPEIERLMKKYTNITWFFTGGDAGQLMAIDKACKNIETQFYLMFDGDYQFIRKGFIQQGLNIIKQDQTLSSVVLMIYQGSQKQNCTILDNIYCSYSFRPAIHRLSHYHKLPGTFSSITRNYSYGFGGGDSLLTVEYNYHLIGKHSFYFMQPFVVHIGDNQGHPRKRGYNLQILQKDYDSLNDKEKGQFKVAYSWRQMYRFHDEAVKSAQLQFRQGIQMQVLPQIKVFGRQMSSYGIDKQIQLHSQFDYLNIQKIKFHRDFVYKYSKLYKYQSKSDKYLKQNTLKQTLCVLIEGADEQYSDSRFEKLVQGLKNFADLTLSFVGSNKSIDIAHMVVQKINAKSQISEIIYNKDVNNYGKMGMFHFSRGFCPVFSIVISLKPTDQLHSMALKVIKKAYQDPKLNFATFRTQYDQSAGKDKKKNLDKKIISQFRAKNNMDLEPFLKTYRHHLLIPNFISHLVQYFYSGNSKSFYPRFYETSSDDIKTYLLIQLGGTEGVNFFDDILAKRTYRKNYQVCQRQKQAYTLSKIRIKNPVKPIVSVTGKIQTVKKYKVGNQLLQQLYKKYQKFQQCLKRVQKSA